MKHRIIERKNYDGYKSFIVQRRLVFWWVDVVLYNELFGMSYNNEFCTKEKAEDLVRRLTHKNKDKVISVFVDGEQSDNL